MKAKKFENQTRIKKNRIILAIKIVLCAVVLLATGMSVFGNSMNKYYKNHNSELVSAITDKSVFLPLNQGVSGRFTAGGDHLGNIEVYLKSAGALSGNMTVQIVAGGEKISGRTVDLTGLTPNSVNLISLDTKLTKGKEYSIFFSSDNAEKVYIPELQSFRRAGKGNSGGEIAAALHFSYRYLEGSYAMQLLTDIVIAFCLALILCTGIIRFEQGLVSVRGGISKLPLALSIYTAFVYCTFFNPLDPERTKVSRFARQFGSGFAVDYDITKVIRNFTLWFILFAACLLLSVFAYTILLNGKKEKKREAFSVLKMTTVIGILSIIFRAITYFAEESADNHIFHYPAYLILVLVLLNFLYVVFPFERFISFEAYQKSIAGSFTAAFPVSVIIAREWESGRFLIGTQIIMTFCVLAFTALFGKAIEKRINCKNFADLFLIFSASAPLLTSIYIELINIMTQYGNVVSCPLRHYITLCILGIVLFVILFVLTRKKDIIKDWKKAVYPLLILGMGFIAVQVPLHYKTGADLFEAANSSVLITDFLRYGDIPVVQHYGGHMMAGVWEGILYGLVNNDLKGAAFSPYCGYIIPVIIIIFYAFLKIFMSADEAFLAVMILPFYGDLLDRSFLYVPFCRDLLDRWGLGLLICLAACCYCRKNTYVRAFFIWIACIICTQYLLDLGYSFIIGILASLVIYVIYTRNRRAFLQLLISGVVTVTAVGIAWCVLCIAKDVNPVSRLYEFLKISDSNINWSYDSMGDKSKFLFAWQYMILPFVACGALLYTVISHKYRSRISKYEYICILTLGIAYFANYPRSLVRHNLLVNDKLGVWTVYLFLALFISTFFKRKQWIIPLYTGFVIVNAFFFSNANFSDVPRLETAASTIADTTDSWRIGRFQREEEKNPKTKWQKLEDSGEDIKRVSYTKDLENAVYSYKDAFDVFLNKDETYIDFVNKTFIYSATGKEDPVYAAQSPGHLSGDYTQKQFIHEIEKKKDKVPLALMPYKIEGWATALDGIQNAYRYYYVAEYIYNHYIPLCTVDDFALWVQPERYEEFRAKIPAVTDELNLLKENAGTKAVYNSCNASNSNEGITFSAVDSNPRIEDLQKVLQYDHSGKTKKISLQISYSTETPGNMQMFYTSDAGEDYTEDKSISEYIEGTGTAIFTVPITKDTRLRLDFPDGSAVTVTKFGVGSEIVPAEYGYDGPYYVNGSTVYGTTHDYTLNMLPYLWAEYDDDKAASNPVICEAENDGEFYDIGTISGNQKKKGNYLLINADYAGTDDDEHPKEDDETAPAAIELGTHDAGRFAEKCRYNFSWKEGRHQYLIRVSTDYYWKTGDINSIHIEPAKGVSNLSVSVLAGD